MPVAFPARWSSTATPVNVDAASEFEILSVRLNRVVAHRAETPIYEAAGKVTTRQFRS